jgi:hypothetical protein
MRANESQIMAKFLQLALRNASGLSQHTVEFKRLSPSTTSASCNNACAPKQPSSEHHGAIRQQVMAKKLA